jgi:hypothetical protein
MRAVLKYLCVAVLASILVYCVHEVTNHPDGSPGPDARAQDAAMIMDGTVPDGAVPDAGVIPAQCDPCLRRTVYAGTLDDLGYASIQLPDFDLADPPSIVAYYKDLGYFDAPWRSLPAKFSDQGNLEIGCQAGVPACEQYATYSYRVVVIK